MSKKQKENSEQKASIDGKDYLISDLSEEQIVLVNQTADLDRKISSSQFNLQQLQVGRNAMMGLLTDSLAAAPEEAEIA